MKCKLCDREFKSYCGLATHAAKAHKMSIDETYVLHKLNGLRPTCGYQGCENEPYFKGSTRGFAYNCSIHRGKWQEGLTTSTDDRIKRRGIAISKAQVAGAHWSSNDEARSIISQKISIARKASKKPKQPGKYDTLSKGSSWSKGLTRDTDPRIAIIGDAVKASLKENGSWSKGLTKESDWRVAKISQAKMMSHDEVMSRFSKREIEFELVSTISEYAGYQIHLDVKCRTCKTLQKKTLKSLDDGSRCYVCFPYGLTSKYQNEIFEWVKTLSVDVQQTRQVISPYEIDVFIPQKSFGIELNGLYWHSDRAGADPKKHQIKSDMAKMAGVRLLHIFEDEWRDKQNIVKSMIVHALGMSTSLYARSCVIDSNPHFDDVKQFLDQSHLDGSTNRIEKAFVLRYENEIVACMTLRKPFMHADGAIEIARFCCKKNTNVVGGLSRLVKHAIIWSRENGFKKLMTYADQRLGQDSAYTKVGFVQLSDTSIRFWWTDLDKRFNRFKFRATTDQTQAQVAEAAGMTRIWGCKNSRYVMEL